LSQETLLIQPFIRKIEQKLKRKPYQHLKLVPRQMQENVFAMVGWQNIFESGYLMAIFRLKGLMFHGL
jgi:hypothetical protein